MLQLAIRGHATRGREVIQLLEMLGGKSNGNIKGYNDDLYYYIAKDGLIYGSGIEYEELVCNYTIFTLEEFLEKFPYKVGGKVIFGDIDNIVWEIESMQWANNEIKYIIRDNNKSRLCDIKTEHLQPYKEETMEEIKSIDLNKLEQQLDEALAKETPESLNKWLDEELEPEPKAPILSNRYDYAEGKCGYVIPDGYEFDSIKQGFQTEIIIRPIKPQYPKTYEECCQHLGCDDKLNVGELIPFQQLVNARNAYWKIAGEQMGLRKPWGPDWKNYEEQKYCIKTDKGEITLSEAVTGNKILAFPTKEMRDAFLENFEDLIKECKELL